MVNVVQLLPLMGLFEIWEDISCHIEAKYIRIHENHHCLIWNVIVHMYTPYNKYKFKFFEYKLNLKIIIVVFIMYNIGTQWYIHSWWTACNTSITCASRAASRSVKLFSCRLRSVIVVLFRNISVISSANLMLLSPISYNEHSWSQQSNWLHKITWWRGKRTMVDTLLDENIHGI